MGIGTVVNSDSTIFQKFIQIMFKTNTFYGLQNFRLFAHSLENVDVGYLILP